MKLLKLKDSSLAAKISAEPITVTTAEHVFALQCATENNAPFIMRENFGVISIGYDTFVKKVFYIKYTPCPFVKKFLSNIDEFINMLDDDSAALFKAYVDGISIKDIPALLRDLANEIEDISTDNTGYNRIPLTTICDQLKVALGELRRTRDVQARWTIKDGKRIEWESIKTANSADDEAAAGIHYAERWATEMEKSLFPVLTKEEIEEIICKIVNEAAYTADENVNVSQYAHAIVILINVWEYGDVLLNLIMQERVNPTILTTYIKTMEGKSK